MHSKHQVNNQSWAHGAKRWFATHTHTHTLTYTERARADIVGDEWRAESSQWFFGTPTVYPFHSQTRGFLWIRVRFVHGSPSLTLFPLLIGFAPRKTCINLSARDDFFPTPRRRRRGLRDKTRWERANLLYDLISCFVASRAASSPTLWPLRLWCSLTNVSTWKMSITVILKFPSQRPNFRLSCDFFPFIIERVFFKGKYFIFYIFCWN